MRVHPISPRMIIRGYIRFDVLETKAAYITSIHRIQTPIIIYETDFSLMAPIRLFAIQFLANRSNSNPFNLLPSTFDKSVSPLTYHLSPI